MSENEKKIVPVLTKLVSQIKKSKFFVYKQKQRTVARQFVAGIINEIKIQNIPPTFKIEDIVDFYQMNNLIINDIQLQFAYLENNIIILDNKQSDYCEHVAIAAAPDNQVIIMAGFERTSLKINLVEEMNNLLCVFKEQNVFKNYDLNYVPPIQLIKRANNFTLEQYALFNNNKMEYMQQLTVFDPQIHRFAAVIFLNPIFPVFEYYMQLIYQMQLQYPEVYFLNCVKGCVNLNAPLTQSQLDSNSYISKLFEASYFHQFLNFVYETKLVAEEYLGKTKAFACQIIDFFPRENQKITTADKKVLFADQFRKLVDQFDAQYNIKCNLHPTFIFRAGEIDELMDMLESAFQERNKISRTTLHINFDDMQKKNQLVFFGIKQQFRVFLDHSKNCYTCIVLLNNINLVNNQLIQLVKNSLNVNYYFLVKGIFITTLQQSEQFNVHLQKINVVYDDSNVFRILKEIYASSKQMRENIETNNNDYKGTFLYDQELRQVKNHFDVFQIQEFIECDTEIKRIKQEFTLKAKAQQEKLTKQSTMSRTWDLSGVV